MTCILGTGWCPHETALSDKDRRSPVSVEIQGVVPLTVAPLLTVVPHPGHPCIHAS